jgi:hypothetical protein
MRDELVTVMLRCISRYRLACDRFSGLDFWTKVAPIGLRELQEETKTATNHLANFIANGDNYYQIIHETGALTPFNDLEKAYSNHMKFQHKIDKAKIGGDRHPIKAAGFIVESVNLCKTCHLQCSKATCGAHYNAANRYRKLIVQNMRISHT